MTFYYLPVLLLVVVSCATDKTSSSETVASDSTTSVIVSPVNAEPAAPVEEATPDSLLSKVDPGLKGSDTLYNILARQKLLVGELERVTVITENLLEPSSLAKSRKLMAVLIQTGEGEYIGSRENISFAYVHNVLAVFDPADRARLVTYMELEGCNSYNIIASSADGQALEMVKGHEAARIHFKGGESGAGDHEDRRETVEIYALVDNKLALIFNYTEEDFSYSSDEQGSFSQTTISMAFSMEELSPDRMPVIHILNSTDRQFSSGEEGEEEKEEEASAPEEEPNPEEIYKFNGSVYEKVNS